MPSLPLRLSHLVAGWMVLVVVMSATASMAVAQTPGPLTPNQEKAKLRLADRNLQIELVTSEPYLTSPVDVAWDADGRLYVAEITDYPTGRPSGRVVAFEDVDNDGTYDQFMVFAENLDSPTSVLPYRDGVLVMTARDIVYLIDADSDGISEKREVILTGLKGAHPLLRPGSMQWGLDNWIYASHGGQGQLRRPKDPQSKAVAVDGRDFRFLPDGSRIDPLTGASAAGLAMDPYGARFPSSPASPLQHVVLEDRYFSRNPQLAPKLPVIDILDASASKRLAGASPSMMHDQWRAGRGSHFFRGNGLPTRYLHNIFLPEPRLNLIHRRRVEPAGATFVARRADEQAEFLTSLDPWFRPVAVDTGPDGALYIVDFYRGAYEYPELEGTRARTKPELARGVERGRLWRVRPVDRIGRQRLGTTARPQLFQASNEALVSLLGHENGWWRETAQRLLVERNAQDMIPALRSIFTEQRSAKARLHALWALEGLNGIDDKTLIAALQDVYPGVRGSALRLAEPRIAKSPEIRAAAIATIVDTDPRVRLELAATLGDLTGDDVAATLSTIALENAGDPWVRRTLFGALARDPSTFLEKLLDGAPALLSAPTVEQAQMLQQAAELIGARNQPAELTRLLKRAAPASGGPTLRGQRALLTGLAEGMARADRPLRTVRGELASMGADATHVEKLLMAARETASAPTADVGQRLAAIRLLAEDHPAQVGPALLALVTGPQPAAVQNAAVRAIVSSSDATQIEALLSGWTGLSPSARRETVAALLRAPLSRELLIAALESARIPPADLEPGAIDALKYLPEEAQRNRITKLIGARTPLDRAALVTSYAEEIAALAAPVVGEEPQSPVETADSVAHGAELFTQHCLACHQASEHGRSFGPELALGSPLPPGLMLGKLLDPSRELLPSQVVSVVITKSGQVFYGAVALETPQALSLRRSDGQEVTLPRSQIAAIHATGRSLMPEGYESILSPADVADLLAFLIDPKLELLPPSVRIVAEDPAFQPIAEAAAPATPPMPTVEATPNEPAAEPEAEPTGASATDNTTTPTP